MVLESNLCLATVSLDSVHSILASARIHCLPLNNISQVAPCEFVPPNKSRACYMQPICVLSQTVFRSPSGRAQVHGALSVT